MFSLFRLFKPLFLLSTIILSILLVSAVAFGAGKDDQEFSSMGTLERHHDITTIDMGGVDLDGSSMKLYARTIEVKGETKVLNNDITTARENAIILAKWNALSKVVGVDITPQVVDHNNNFVISLISSLVHGYANNYTINSEKHVDDYYVVSIKFVLEPNDFIQASKIFSQEIAVNTEFSLENESLFQSDESALARVLNDYLINQHLDVHNYFGLQEFDENAPQKNSADFLIKLRQNLVKYQFYGHIGFISNNADSRTLSNNNKIVVAEFSYRLYSHSDNKVILDKLITVKGVGSSLEFAKINAVQNILDQQLGKVALEVVNTIINYNSHIVTIKIVGDINDDQFEKFYGKFNYLNWVINIKKTDKRTIVVNYANKNIFLVKFMTSISNADITRVDGDTIIARFN